MAFVGVRIQMDSNFFVRFKKDVRREVNRKFKAIAPAMQTGLRTRMRQIVNEAIKSEDEYNEITGGVLRAELGVPNSRARIDAIIDRWISSIFIKVQPGTAPLLDIQIGIIDSSYQDVLAMAEAEYTYRSRHYKRNVTIPWLQWLLTEGTKRLVTGYHVVRNPRRSRTGTVIMRQNDRKSWSVPSTYSGTAGNNFVTRAFSDINQKIIQVIDELLIRNL